MELQICLVPKLLGLGGTASFQSRLIDGLKNLGISYSFEISDKDNSAVLIIGGSRQLVKLWQAKRRGVRIVQRLNGMNWMHRVEKTPLKVTLRSEINNRILAYIRANLADAIVYQSEFSRVWWERVYGEHPIPNSVTYNGVDLEQYSPYGPETPPEDHYRILLLEGRLVGQFSRGLFTAVKLAKTLQTMVQLPVELMVVGMVTEDLIAQAYTLEPDLWITWTGVLPRNSIPVYARGAHVLFSADLNAACPNSVIEAMSCGLPVLAYDTGALSELVQNGSGEVVPYGANHWQLENPVILPLAEACLQILQNNAIYRQAARARAEAAFSLDKMVQGYLDVLGGK